jgi:hypothetical protein
MGIATDCSKASKQKNKIKSIPEKSVFQTDFNRPIILQANPRKTFFPPQLAPFLTAKILFFAATLAPFFTAISTQSSVPYY